MMQPIPDQPEPSGVEDAPAEERMSEEEQAARLDALGQSLSASRAEAIAARQASGIEQNWLEDEEFYEGIDDANRGEMRSNLAWRGKPMGQAVVAPPASGSTVFPNITRPYCDAAAARIADMLLPTDDRNWEIQTTPIPELVELSKGKYPQGMVKQAAAGNPGHPELARQQLAQATEESLQVIEQAKAKAKKAQERIEDWQDESGYQGQLRLVIEDAARIGTGVLKGPIPTKKRCTAYINGQIVIKEEIKPVSKRVDPWNFFPAKGCGENIHNGVGTWERDYLSHKGLRALKGTPGYIDAQIDRCLEEGPMQAVAATEKDADKTLVANQSGEFEIWYYHGDLDRDDLEAAGCECEDEKTQVPALVTMVNGRVIRASLNPLDSGEFPYDVMVWQRRSGMVWGTGVARQIRTPQRIVVAATRAMMENAGLASGPQIVMKQGIVTPENGKWTIGRLKVWLVGEDGDIDDVRKAMNVVQIPMMQAELERIVVMGLKLAEDVTGLPMLLQGQMGPDTPDTLGGQQIVNNNASSVLRRLAKLFDDLITEPHIKRYYTWLLQYGEDEEKGEYIINARGSSALVERDLQNQQLVQLIPASLNPTYGLDPKKTMIEYLKSLKFDPKNFQFDDENWQKIVENMANGPSDPRLAVAQLRAQHEEKMAEAERQFNAQLKQIENRFEEQENTKDRAAQILVKEMERTGQKSISLDDIKARLAETTIKITAQERMSARSERTKQILKPPVEPAGRAAPGKAFQH
jgi:hypothetical protein